MIVVLVFALFLGGCTSHWVKLDPAQPPATNGNWQPERPVALVIEDVSVQTAGTGSNVQQGFVQRVASTMRRSDLFSTVYLPEDAHEAPAGSIRMRLTVEENVDAHLGAAALKGFFIGLTMFLLAPALPLDVDMDQAITCELVLPGSVHRTYDTNTGGTASFHLFANGIQVGQELGGKITDRNLGTLIAKMRDDAAFQRALMQ